MVARAKKLAEAKLDDKDFWKHPSVNSWPGLVQTTPKAAGEAQRTKFLSEWRSTVQVLRDIGDLVSRSEHRPAWIDDNAPAGVQADQFLHAHYYKNTFDGRRADFETHFQRNCLNPALARQRAISWWAGLAELPDEARTVNETAPWLRERLSRDGLRAMTAREFREVTEHIHAIREYSRRVANQTVALPSVGVQYSIPAKLDALTTHIWNSRTANGSTVIGVMEFILYGGEPDLLPDRLWKAITDPQLKMSCMGVSALGELVGWAMPDRFPPRNGRTSKALRSLGYDVRVHV